MTGQKFGRLTVLYQTEDYIKPNGKHYAKYHCICECGNECDVQAQLIKNGQTKSCGCYQREQTTQKLKKHNEYKIENNVVYIKLSNCNEYTIVDLDKWNEISYIKEFCWYKGTKNYVRSVIPKQYQKQFNKSTIGLHQLICPCKDGYEPDHIDRNPLNNLTKNLQSVTTVQNNWNRGLHCNNTSGCKGVTWDKRQQKWKVYITVKGKYYHLGYFDDINNAINARKKAEEKFFGEFRYNFTNKQNNIKEENNE